MITDPIGDLFTRIRNAALARKEQLSVPYSKLKHSIARVLEKEGYLAGVRKESHSLVLTLGYKGSGQKSKKLVITGLRSISKPGLRIYRKASKLPSPLRGGGVAIVSTPKGVMTDKEARKRGFGGEVLGEVW